MIDKNRLRSAIVSAGYTQKRLASEMGISKNTISAKINGKKYFNTQEIDNMCNILGIYDCNEKTKFFLPPSSQKRDNNYNQSTS